MKNICHKEDREIYVLDFCLDYFEKEEPIGDLGYKKDNIINIDHHFPVKKFNKYISTTNLIIEYMKKHTINKNSMIVINHTDCDSILSAGILSGRLAPLDIFAEAAISEDHTGQESLVGDLLDELQQYRDPELSFRNLTLLMENKPLEKVANDGLHKRNVDRKIIGEIAGEFKYFQNKVAYLEIGAGGRKFSGVLLPAYLKKAAIIVVFIHKQNATKVITRLGMSAPDGLDLRDIMQKVDPNWGGRWNAGGNERMGGTNIPVMEYLEKINNAL